MKPLHRIREVRLREGLSIRTASQRTGVSKETLQSQEHVFSDLKLSDVLRWRDALGVPLTELLIDDSQQTQFILQRGRLIRLMKTALTIQQNSTTDRQDRLAEMLIEQIIEIMPELKKVKKAWHKGERRTLDDLGRVAERVVPDDLLDADYEDYF